jgi:type IV fimbrial biogenesis protein FimT
MGFTLIELMITLVLAGVLLAIAVPSFTDATRRNRIVTQSNAIYTAIKIARSEAAKLGTITKVCSSTNQSTCNGDANWHNGWIVLDVDNNVVRVGDAFANGVTMVASAGGGKSASILSFRPDGLVDDPTASVGILRLSFVLRAPNCGLGEQRTITVNNLGMSAIVSGDCP